MGAIDFYVDKFIELGLQQGKDFYVSCAEVSTVDWLKSAALREVKPNCSLGMVIWDGYKHNLDNSLEVVIWEDQEELPTKVPQAFPTCI